MAVAMNGQNNGTIVFKGGTARGVGDGPQVVAITQGIAGERYSGLYDAVPTCISARRTCIIQREDGHAFRQNVAQLVNRQHR